MLARESILLLFLGLAGSIILSNIFVLVRRYFQNIRTERRTRQLIEKQKDVSSRSSIPVTILTGFLGSGKTSLLNIILKRKKSKLKIMVIENEIGKISVDHALLCAPVIDSTDTTLSDSSGVYVMENGCMCCSNISTGNELERILDQLLVISNVHGYEYVIVETSGLADPGPIIRTFLHLKGSNFALDSVVAMIDSYSFPLHAEKQTVEMRRQLTYADVVVMSKIDLVSKERLEAVENFIYEAYPQCQVLRHSIGSPVNIADLLSINTFDVQRFREIRDQDAHHTPGIALAHAEVVGELDLKQFIAW